MAAGGCITSPERVFWTCGSDIHSCLQAVMMVMQGLFSHFFCVPAYFIMNSKESSKLGTINFHSLCSLPNKRHLSFFEFLPVHFYFDTFCSAYFIHNAYSHVQTEITRPTAVLCCVCNAPQPSDKNKVFASQHYPHRSPDYVKLFSVVQLVVATNATPPSLPRVPLWSFGCLWSWLVSSRWCFRHVALLSAFHSWACLAAITGRKPETMAVRWDFEIFQTYTVLL